MLMTEVGSPFEHEHPLMMVCSRGVVINSECVTRGKDLILHKNMGQWITMCIPYDTVV